MTPISAARLCTLLCCSAAVFALSYGGIAHAITDTIFQYKTPKTGYFSIAPLALTPSSTGNATNYVLSPPDFASALAADKGVCLVAAVNFPDGAQIKSATTWFSTDRDLGVSVLIYRNNPATGNAIAFFDMQSQDTSETRISMTQVLSEPPFGKVNNQHFNYEALVCLANSNTKFYGARITYMFTDAGD